MSSLVKPVMSIIWFQVMGVFLDNKKVSVRWKLLGTWGFLQSQSDLSSTEKER
jgi:hypothetical protein